MRTLLVRALQNDYACTTAADVAEARKRLDEERFDLVLSDIDMPDGTGLELARNVLGREGKTAVFLMTADSSAKRAAEAVDIGVHGYMLKPFGLDELRGRVAETLGRTGGAVLRDVSARRPGGSAVSALRPSSSAC
jgi:two-component system response regulator PilR (NtrC family)